MRNVSNKIPLTADLVAELKGYQKNIRENTIAMALKAWAVRSQYLSEDGRKYDSEFETWWSSNKLNSVLGGRSNFTKLASGGEAFENAKFDKYSDRMPSTLAALYEVSLLTRDELKLCVHDRYSRTSLTGAPKGNKTPSPLNHPEVTAAEIRNWRKKWRNPPIKSTDKRRLPYATIKVHDSLYDFDKAGTHGGVLNPEKLKNINDVLLEAMQPFDEYVRINTNLDALLEGHRKRQEQAEIRAEKALVRAEKKAAQKKSKKQ